MAAVQRCIAKIKKNNLGIVSKTYSIENRII